MSHSHHVLFLEDLCSGSSHGSGMCFLLPVFVMVVYPTQTIRVVLPRISTIPLQYLLNSPFFFFHELVLCSSILRFILIYLVLELNTVFVCFSYPKLKCVADVHIHKNTHWIVNFCKGMTKSYSLFLMIICIGKQ